MSAELAVLVPVLGRPHRVDPLLESLAAATPEPHIVRFVVDPGDIKEQVAIREAGHGYIVHAGNYAAKINQAVELTDEPLLFLAADDLNFWPGWLEAAKRRLSTRVGVVGTNDLCNRRTATGELSTHSLVARWYAELGTIDEPGKLLHEGYPHEWVDDELVATAKHRGMYAHAPDSVVEHLHPMVGKAPMDELYAQMRPRIRQGRRIFQAREHLWAA